MGNKPPLASVVVAGAVLSISLERCAACEHRSRRLLGGTGGNRPYGSIWLVMAVQRQLRGLLHTTCSSMQFKTERAASARTVLYSDMLVASLARASDGTFARVRMCAYLVSILHLVTAHRPKGARRVTLGVRVSRAPSLLRMSQEHSQHGV